jgi:selenocysteine lyase/cysteine desulfurase
MTKYRSMNVRDAALTLDRREFLKIAGGTALGSAALSNPFAALASDPDDIRSSINPSWPEHVLWKKVKELFVLDKRSTYMNIGTTGSMPRQVLKNYNDYNVLVASDPWDMGSEWGDWPHTDELTARIAPQFGCASDELILSRNTSDGTLSVIHGLDLRVGDHVIATHHEHVAVTAPLGVIAERNGVDVEYVAIPVFPTDPEDYVDVIMDAVTPETRLIVISHIPYKTGALLPVKRICHEAAAMGIVTLIDGAHASGMLNLNLHDLDCDFYAASGHKWQCGPGSTGLLYVRENASRVADFFPKDRKPFYAVNASLAGLGLPLNWTLQYKGNDNYPALRALADSCDLWDQIGRDRIEERVKGLSSLTKSLIFDAFPRAVGYSPDYSDMTSGITTFNPFADQSDLAVVKEFRDRLREEYGYIIRYTNFHEGLNDPRYTYALRISTHLFHDENDVEGLVAAMADLYVAMQPA